MSDKSIVSIESGVSYYRASAISLPPFCLAAHRMGYESLPPPPKLREAFDEGHKWEGKIVRTAATNLGMKIAEELDGSQYEIIIPIGTQAAIRGHIDAIFIDETDTRHGFEAKALGPDWFNLIKSKGIEAVEHYADQLTCYWHGTGIESWYFGMQPKAEPYSDPHIIHLTSPPSDINKLKAKVMVVEAGIRAGKDFTEFEYTPHGFCGVWYLHPDKEEDDTPITPNELIDTLSKTYKDAEDETKQAKAKLAAVKTQLIEAMGGKEGKVATGTWEVKLANVMSMRFNQKAMTDDLGPEIIEKYKRPVESTRIWVKPSSADERLSE